MNLRRRSMAQQRRSGLLETRHRPASDAPADTAHARSAAADFVESRVRPWLRQRQLAYCAHCIIAGLQHEGGDTSGVRRAVAALAKRPAFSVGHCLCGAMGVRYRSPMEPR
jgi:hypothetical protein